MLSNFDSEWPWLTDPAMLILPVRPKGMCMFIRSTCATGPPPRNEQPGERDGTCGSEDYYRDYGDQPIAPLCCAYC